MDARVFSEQASCKTRAATGDSALAKWRTNRRPLPSVGRGGAQRPGRRNKTMNRRGDAERAARVVRAFTYPTRSRARGQLIRPAPGAHANGNTTSQPRYVIAAV